MAVTQGKGQTPRSHFSTVSLRASSLLTGGSTYHTSDVSTVHVQDAFLHRRNTQVTATDLPVTARWCHWKPSRRPLLLLAREPWALPSGLVQHEFIFSPTPAKVGL